LLTPLAPIDTGLDRLLVFFFPVRFSRCLFSFPACASPRQPWFPVLLLFSRATALLPGTSHIATTVPEIRKALCRRARRAVRPVSRQALRGSAQKLLQACDSPGAANLRRSKRCVGKYFLPTAQLSYRAGRRRRGDMPQLAPR
jgi:hypothetical protein